ncbi:hypothetical protein B0H11DRAFT_2259710 [Mycena galericulata]|nr:hypothetical protein B0H11DRAFT_2259710 [Mycena galericulata]
MRNFDWKWLVNDKGFGLMPPTARPPASPKSLTDSKLPNVTTLFMLTEASVLQKISPTHGAHSCADGMLDWKDMKLVRQRTQPVDARNSAPRRGAKLVNGNEYISSISSLYLRLSTLLAPAHEALLDLLSESTQSAVNSNLRTAKAASW